MRKNTITQRLNIIKGQIDALSKIIDDEKNCKKTIEQFRAVNSGLKRVVELYLQENLASCLQSTTPKDKERINTILGEFLKIS
ncbi:metal-sensitive transcriptional regulator [Candidatus Gracilibacteria bacterium]|nr:metal-sensitive transcriptional regulator [Candidatus Gracilibacteria bacterium]